MVRWGAASLAAAMCLGSFVVSAAESAEGEVLIALSDDEIRVDGKTISTENSDAVYTGADIIYYREGQESTYGEGDQDDEHSAEEAEAQNVITITQAGTYRVTGSLSAGQIAIDLGEEAKDDEQAKVTLILDNADITCSVAPAIMVYAAYECGSDDTETASSDVDTTQAGFTLVLADDSENTVNGSHVAKIYKEGTTQEDIDSGEAKKAWKMDAAIESYVSFNIEAQEEGNGSLTVNADNEGIESAMHLTIDGGNITIYSADDAINASEDDVSVITINGGSINANAGDGQEGDGIDSNGWIVINDGYVIASANGASADSGVDSDRGILINGGTVLASGNMYDAISTESAATYIVLNFSETQQAKQLLMLKNSEGKAVTAFYAENAFTTMVYAAPELQEGEYTLYAVSDVTGEQKGTVYTELTDYRDETQLTYGSTVMNGGPGGSAGAMGDRQPGNMPEGMGEGEMPNMPEGERPELPEGMSEGEMPNMPESAQAEEQSGMPEGERPELPEGMSEGEMPQMPGQMQGSETQSGESQTVMTITAGGNTFSQISATEVEASEVTSEE